MTRSSTSCALHMAMTIYYLIQLKLYFQVFTILTFIYTKMYLAYFFSISIVHNNYTIEVSHFFIIIYLNILMHFQNKIVKQGWVTVTPPLRINFIVNIKSSISHKVTSDYVVHVVESRVLARLEVSGSNPDLRKCAYFVNKIIPRWQRGLWWLPVGWSIFCFLFCCFQAFSNFFLFLKLIYRGAHVSHSYKLIFSCEKQGQVAHPPLKIHFYLPLNFFSSDLIALM